MVQTRSWEKPSVPIWGGWGPVLLHCRIPPLLHCLHRGCQLLEGLHVPL